MKHASRRMWPLGLLVLTAATGAYLYLRPSGELSALPKEPVIAVLPAEVETLIFKNSVVDVTLRSLHTDEGFDIAVRPIDGQPSQECRSSKNLLTSVRTLFSISAHRLLSPEQLATDFPLQIGKVDIVDRLTREGPISMVFYTSRDLKRTALLYGDTRAEIDVSYSTFERLQSPCTQDG